MNDISAGFVLVALFLIPGLLVYLFIIPERARYRRMKVRAYQSLVYAEYLANHFGVSKDKIQHIISKEEDPVLGDDYAKLDKALDLFGCICYVRKISDPYSETQLFEEEECSEYDDYPV
jgi:hypothetical protein